MSVAVEVTYGWVWCPCCEKIVQRKRDTEPALVHRLCGLDGAAPVRP